MAIVITGVEKPKKCKECKLFCGHYSDVCCMVTGYNLDRKAVEETVPEWCPIIEVPKKRVHVPRSVENPEYVDGFNACVGIKLLNYSEYTRIREVATEAVERLEKETEEKKNGKS